LELISDRQPLLCEVSRIIRQPEHFALAHAENDDEHVSRIEGVVVSFGRCQELPCVLCGPTIFLLLAYGRYF
jgi:hypothetical protein